MQIANDTEKLEIRLEERIQQIRRELTAADRKERLYLSPNQKWTQEKIPTGELVLTIRECSNKYGLAKTWKETPETPIETVLDDVLAQVAGMFEELRLKRVLEHEEQLQQRKIAEERRQVEMERKRETIRFRRLLNHSQNARISADIRAFVETVEDSSLATKDPEQYSEWKVWALGHADRIDPLRSDNVFDRNVGDYEVYSMKD